MSNDSLVAAHLEGARMARRLAHEWRQLGRDFPRDAERCEAEAKRAFARARDYLRYVKRNGYGRDAA